MTCKACGGPVPLRTHRNEPRTFCKACRMNVGETNSQAKLKAADVLAIRKAPPPYALVAEAFGSQATICDIRKRRSWGHL